MLAEILCISKRSASCFFSEVSSESTSQLSWHINKARGIYWHRCRLFGPELLKKENVGNSVSTVGGWECDVPLFKFHLKLELCVGDLVKCCIAW